jgi:hypothetical protein
MKKTNRGRSAKVLHPIYEQIEQVTKVLSVYSIFEDEIKPQYVQDLLAQLQELLDTSTTICINDAERHEEQSEPSEEVTTSPQEIVGQLIPMPDSSLITYSLSSNVLDDIALDEQDDIVDDTDGLREDFI